MRSDLAVKWLSLVSIKSEQVSKICSMVKRLSHPMNLTPVSTCIPNLEDDCFLDLAHTNSWCQIIQA